MLSLGIISVSTLAGSMRKGKGRREKADNRICVWFNVRLGTRLKHRTSTNCTCTFSCNKPNQHTHRVKNANDQRHRA